MNGPTTTYSETVTGSKHLLRTPAFNILIDCGLFQGLKALRVRNWQPPVVDPAGIDVLILTHAHLDHCGQSHCFCWASSRLSGYFSACGDLH